MIQRRPNSEFPLMVINVDEQVGAHMSSSGANKEMNIDVTIIYNHSLFINYVLSARKGLSSSAASSYTVAQLSVWGPSSLVDLLVLFNLLPQRPLMLQGCNLEGCVRVGG